MGKGTKYGRSTKGAGHKREEGLHLSIPTAFLKSNLRARLGRSAKNLVDDLGAQYNLGNNGQLRATFEKLKHLGWGSEATLFKARRELENAGVIFETKKGGRPNRASWYALTFFDLDPHPDYDISPKAYPGKGSWRLKDGAIGARPAMPLLQNRKPRPVDSANFRSQERGQATETVAIRHHDQPPATTIPEAESRGVPLSRGLGGEGAPGITKPAPESTSAPHSAAVVDLAAHREATGATSGPTPTSAGPVADSVARLGYMELRNLVMNRSTKQGLQDPVVARLLHRNYQRHKGAFVELLRDCVRANPDDYVVWIIAQLATLRAARVG